ncbi:hypothetical protein Tco_0922707 [Tanacetum coccineum]|uniref:Uncharacterized protein n=1 Tax=Tanacetum coccineum TaxID=301880 RepID=A0ABQ5CZW2_9ASTR
MHTSKDDYLINTLRFVSSKEATQNYGVILPESLTSLEMKETKAYKTYLGFATGATPPKKARKFKKPASPQLSIVPVSPEEPTRKSKRVKRPAKKSTKAPTGGVVIRETPEMFLSKKKEKMIVENRKGIDLLSKVALTKATKIKPSVTNEGTDVKPGVPDVTEEESTKSEAESWGNDEDDSNNDNNSESDDSDEENDSDDKNTQSDSEKGSDSEHETDENESGSEFDQEENEEAIGDDEEEEEDELVKTSSNDSHGEDETKITDKAKGDDDEEMDYTTSQLYDDVDIRLNKPVQAGDETVQKEGTNVEMINVQRGNENSKISQVIEDAHVTLSTVPRKTEVPVTSSSHSFDLAAKFLNFADIPTTDAKIVSPMDVPVYHEVPSGQTPTLLTVPVSVIVDTKVGRSLIRSGLRAVSFGPWKSVLVSLWPIRHGSRVARTQLIGWSQPKSSRKFVQSEEPEFEVADSDMPQDQEGNMGNDDDEPMKETVSKRDWFTKSTQPQEPTDPDWNVGKTPQQGQTQNWLMTLVASTDKSLKSFDELMSTPIDFSAYIMNGLKITNLTQKTLLGPSFRLLKGKRTNYVELEYDFEECYNAFSEKLDWENPEGGGVSTMTYTTSITKTKAAQYDLPGIEDIVPNIWSLVKVAYDKHGYGESHIGENNVEVMRKHGYRYPKEIVVRRADNDLYRFKEGHFPRLRINDIEDMLLLVVQNRLTNLLGDDVSDFTIALRMFTRSLVIQKRVEDLQLNVESYQKNINVTKPEITRPGLRKRDTFTPYQDPQGFIYVDNQERNRLMRSDELYKFSDRTLTGLRTLLDDITKNRVPAIEKMEYIGK